MKLLTAKEAGELIGVTHWAIRKYSKTLLKDNNGNYIYDENGEPKRKLAYTAIGNSPKAPKRYKEKDVLSLLVENDNNIYNLSKAKLKEQPPSNYRVNDDIYNEVMAKFNNK